MPFLLLLLVTVACLPARWPEPPEVLGTTASALLTWAVVGLWVAAAGFLAGRLRRQLLLHPDQRLAVLRRYASWKLYHLFSLLGVYLLSLYVLGWVHTARGDISEALFGSKNFPGVELLILAPFLTTLVFSWGLFYDVERTIRDTGPARGGEPFPGRWTYVGFQARHNLILVCPPLLMMVLQQTVLVLFPELDRAWVMPVLSVGLLAAVFLTIPWILRLLLGWKPLPPGPLRDRLLAAARRLDFRCNNILLWNTRRGMANAMVTGFLPFLRYVVITDRLASDLTPEEIEAVFGHEVGHVKHHHMPYYVVFLLVSMGVVAGLYELVVSHLSVNWLEADDIMAVLPLLGMIGVYVFVVFGFLSRRCERQADVYGCRAVSCGTFACPGHEQGTELVPVGRGLCATGIRTFIEALEKVARLNGISRDKPGWLSSWQHSTIARRVDFLQQVCSDPEVERRFQRRVGRVKWALLLGLGAAFLTVILTLVMIDAVQKMLGHL
jgi:Zn-dependent protease with chaperone function